MKKKSLKPLKPFTPRSVNNFLTTQILTPDIRTLYPQEYQELSADGWRFYVVNQSCGKCYHNDKVITIPTWAYTTSRTYITWYIAHELAHAYAGREANHGPEFMEWLKKICPQKAIHHELTYKPRNAVSARIGKQDILAELGF